TSGMQPATLGPEGNQPHRQRQDGWIMASPRPNARDGRGPAFVPDQDGRGHRPPPAGTAFCKNCSTGGGHPGLGQGEKETGDDGPGHRAGAAGRAGFSVCPTPPSYCKLLTLRRKPRVRHRGGGAMRRGASWAAVLLVPALWLAGPLLGAPKAPKKLDVKVEDDKTSEKMIKARLPAGKVLSVSESSKTIKLQVTVVVAVLNQSAVTGMAQAQRDYQMALLRRDRNAAAS